MLNYVYFQNENNWIDNDRYYIAQQLLLAVEYLHSIPAVHGDIKPQNIMVSSPRIYVLL